MTAVEFIESKIFGDEIFSLSKVFEQAKEKHKQEIIDAWIDGLSNWDNTDDYDAKHYYNKRFNN